MNHALHFAPAGTLPLDQLAKLFTNAFEDYFVPVLMLPEQLAQRMRSEQIDLWHSSVLSVAGEPAGVALIALRGSRGWCGGFGIRKPWRGQGLALPLAHKMLEEARAGGAQQFTLEVLAQNKRAAQVYARAGFVTQRDLLILEWRHTPGQELASGPSLAALDPARMLALFEPFHQVQAAWQRDLPSLLVRGGLHNLTLLEDDSPRAYALYQELPSGGARLMDLGARDSEAAALLLGGLKQQFARLITVNEPTDSLFAGALVAAGFVELDRQHEMAIMV